MSVRTTALVFLFGTSGCGLWTIDDKADGSAEIVDSADPSSTDSSSGPDDAGGGDAAGSGTDGGDTTDSGSTEAAMDEDNDGVSSDLDCDDTDPDRFPGNPELCDGIDNDCSGDAEVDGDGVCGFWLLDAETSTWTAHPMVPIESVHAPTTPIDVAFSVGRERIWVLTANTFHVLALDSLEWISSGDRDTLFPEASGLDLTLAIKAPNSWDAQDGDATVNLQYGFSALVYTWDAASSSFSLFLATDLGTDWQSALAPAASSVQAAWLGHDAEYRWTGAATPRTACDTDEASLGPYFGALTVDHLLHLYDAGHCFGFVSAMPAATFSIFNYPNAPDAEVLGATSWTGAGLIAFVHLGG